jgi:hypothetical protein
MHIGIHGLSLRQKWPCNLAVYMVVYASEASYRCLCVFLGVALKRTEGGHRGSLLFLQGSPRTIEALTDGRCLAAMSGMRVYICPPTSPGTASKSCAVALVCL